MNSYLNKFPITKKHQLKPIVIYFYETLENRPEGLTVFSLQELFNLDYVHVIIDKCNVTCGKQFIIIYS